MDAVRRSHGRRLQMPSSEFVVVVAEFDSNTGMMEVASASCPWMRQPAALGPRKQKARRFPNRRAFAFAHRLPLSNFPIIGISCKLVREKTLRTVFIRQPRRSMADTRYGKVR